MIEDVDVLIVGGGIIGSALMRALSPLNLNVLLIDDKPLMTNASSFDARSVALSSASIQILTALNVWPLLMDKATPIEKIHVSEKGALGHARLLGSHQNPLGAVVEMHDLGRVFDVLLDKNHDAISAKLTAYDLKENLATIKTIHQARTIRARIVVGADGAESFLRECCQLPVQTKNYQQQALVANIGLARAHQYVAYERFTPEGPIAMLPMSNLRSSLIWVNSPEETAELNQLDDDVFVRRLQRTFGYRLGRFVKVGRRSTYPLQQKVMPNKVIQSVVFIGNAAQTLHPIAGQGFNLGLRDVAMLVQCLVKHGLCPKALQQYQTLRQHDGRVITRFTDSLITLFMSQLPGASIARSMGLVAMDNSDVLKNILSRYAGGYGGVVPDLVCGIPMNELTRQQHTS